jgi:hypothetical protein
VSALLPACAVGVARGNVSLLVHLILRAVPPPQHSLLGQSQLPHQGARREGRSSLLNSPTQQQQQQQQQYLRGLSQTGGWVGEGVPAHEGGGAYDARKLAAASSCLHPWQQVCLRVPLWVTAGGYALPALSGLKGPAWSPYLTLLHSLLKNMVHTDGGLLSATSS